MKSCAYATDEAVHSPDMYDAINSFDFDLPFWLDRCGKADGPILELCCGSGRLTIPLFKAGFPIQGADLSEKMLEGLRRKAEAEGVGVVCRRADMRDFSFDESFSLIFIPFNSFQCLYDSSEIESALNCIRRHLSSSGRFILDVFNPSLELMVDRNRNELRGRFIELPGRGRTEWRERCAYDAAAQVTRVTWTFVYPDGSQEVQRLDMRCFYPQEIAQLLKSTGFIVEEVYGDYDFSPFHSGSQKQILVCRAR